MEQLRRQLGRQRGPQPILPLLPVVEVVLLAVEAVCEAEVEQVRLP